MERQESRCVERYDVISSILPYCSETTPLKQNKLNSKKSASKGELNFFFLFGWSILKPAEGNPDITTGICKVLQVSMNKITEPDVMTLLNSSLGMAE
jgi:hypothetical protein